MLHQVTAIQRMKALQTCIIRNMRGHRDISTLIYARPKASLCTYGIPRAATGQEP